MSSHLLSHELLDIVSIQGGVILLLGGWIVNWKELQDSSKRKRKIPVTVKEEVGTNQDIKICFICTIK